MKKIQSICIVALLAAFALTSCNYTDLDPTDMVGPDKAFGNVQNVHKAVVGIYGKASLRSKLAVTEYIADDCVQGGDSGGAGTDLAGWVYTATSGDVSGLWAHYYGIINQANRVLNYGPKVKPLNAEEETSLQVSLGTAYFFRAYAHFELLCFFSDFSNDDALGIPYLSAFFAEMTQWEQYMEQAGFEGTEAVPRLLTIWDKYVSEKPRPGYRPLGLSYSAQSTYNGEEFLDAEQITKNKLYIYTREKNTGFDRRFLMKRVGEGWMIDGVQERLDSWQRTGL